MDDSNTKSEEHPDQTQESIDTRSRNIDTEAQGKSHCRILSITNHHTTYHITCITNTVGLG